jgi:hypothetical protein
MVARDGWRLLGDYRFDPATGLWRHRIGLVEPPLRLNQVGYDDDGTMRYPHHDDRAPESQLADYLTEAAGVLAAAEGGGRTGELTSAGSVSDDFDHLRWFDLPASCLASTA